MIYADDTVSLDKLSSNIIRNIDPRPRLYSVTSRHSTCRHVNRHRYTPTAL
jgi:hypothetical protein